MRAPANSPEIPLPLLITGIAGVPGFNAFRHFSERYPGQVIGTRRRDLWRLRGDGIEACDAEDQAGLASLFDRYGFRSVINSLGSCKLKHCELDPAVAWRVNVLGTQNLLRVIADRGVRMVHHSIDLVFSGDERCPSRRETGYREDDPTNPVTIYGKSMALAEDLILAQRADACILRISLPMGVSFNGHAGAIDWIAHRFATGRPATLYTDEFRTPTYTDCLNELCHTMLGNRMSGVYHAGGTRKLSLYQIAQVVNRIGGYDPRLLRGIPRHEAGPMPPRAGDVAMDCGKLREALGREPFDLWPLDSASVPTHADWHAERPADEEGSAERIARELYRNQARLRRD